MLHNHKEAVLKRGWISSSEHYCCSQQLFWSIKGQKMVENGSPQLPRVQDVFKCLFVQPTVQKLFTIFNIKLQVLTFERLEFGILLSNLHKQFTDYKKYRQFILCSLTNQLIDSLLIHSHFNTHTDMHTHNEDNWFLGIWFPVSLENTILSPSTKLHDHVPKMAMTSSSWMTSSDPDTTKHRVSTLSPAWKIRSPGAQWVVWNSTASERRQPSLANRNAGCSLNTWARGQEVDGYYLFFKVMLLLQ